MYSYYDPLEYNNITLYCIRFAYLNYELHFINVYINIIYYYNRIHIYM